MDDPVRTSLQGLAFAAAAALVLALGYWMLSPGGGPDELKRMQEAIRNASTWRMEYAGSGSEKLVMSGEFACPRVHVVVRRNGPPQPNPFAYQEFLVMEDGRYYRASPDAAWKTVEDAWGLENLCVQVRGGGGNPRFMPSIPDLLLTGGVKVERGERNAVEGVPCRVWSAIHLLKVEDYKNESFCIGDDHLPRERVTSSGRFVYRDWNEPLSITGPIRIELLEPR